VLAALTQTDAPGRLGPLAHRSKALGKVFEDARFGLARAREDLEADSRRAGPRLRMAVFEATNLDADLGVVYELKKAFRVAIPYWEGSATRDAGRPVAAA
jgi:hypothetical protein